VEAAFFERMLLQPGFDSFGKSGTVGRTTAARLEEADDEGQEQIGRFRGCGKGRVGYEVPATPKPSCGIEESSS